MIIHGDANIILSQLPDGMIDLTITSPPLNKAFIGMEISDEYCKIAERRIKEA